MKLCKTEAIPIEFYEWVSKYSDMFNTEEYSDIFLI